jgi:hypothetical protein
MNVGNCCVSAYMPSLRVWRGPAIMHSANSVIDVYKAGKSVNVTTRMAPFAVTPLRTSADTGLAKALINVLSPTIPDRGHLFPPGYPQPFTLASSHNSNSIGSSIYRF